MMVYKIADAEAWRNAENSGQFDGSPDDRRDGYIHFSTTEQLAATLLKHYTGRSRLILAAIDSAKLGEALRWEPARGGELFPHLYGPLPLRAVLWFRPITIDSQGRHVLPAEIA